MDRTSNGQGLSSQMHNVLAGIRQKGIRLWPQDGQLRYQGPKGALTQDERAWLKSHREPIVSFLERAIVSENHEPKRLFRPRQDRAPLSFAQLAHWHLYRLDECPSSCVIPHATRLRGALDIEVLRECLYQLVRRHDALRTRILLLEGVPVQDINDPQNCELQVQDLTAIPQAARESEVTNTLEFLVREPMPVVGNPLTRIRLLKLAEQEHVFILGMEHIISDGVSLRLLLEELLALYRSCIKGQALSLPDIPLQLPDYAFWQRTTHPSWLERHSAYWNSRVNSWRRLRFPQDKPSRSSEDSGCAMVRFQICNNLKSKLSAWCKQHQTTLVMAALTAYVAFVLRWCETSEGVILFQTDGRHSPSIERTIGYFAFPLYLRIELGRSDRFADLLHSVTDEYCRAYEHADFAYLESQIPRPEFTRNSCFNWLRDTPTSSPSVAPAPDGALKPFPVHFDEALEQRLLRDIHKDTEPSVGLLETDGAILGGVYFPGSRFSAESMERFARNYLTFVTALIERPESCVSDVVPV